MVMCAVFNCNNNNNKKLKAASSKAKQIHFYAFPKDPGVCTKWINKCCRADKFNYKNARICSIHFGQDDYERNLKQELLNLTNVPKKLKKIAVPSLNIYNRSCLEVVDKLKERKACKKNKLIVAQLL